MAETKLILRLPVPLTEEEKIQLGNRLADLNISIEGRIDLKRVLPKQIESEQESAAEIAHKLKTGTKIEDVECFFTDDEPTPGMRQLYRYDTGEKVGEPETMPQPGLFEEGEDELIPANTEADEEEEN